ncbi:unnamed protein product [Gordionus sp. m RMFG-2023]|uniref:retinal dehydrogenase 2-like n=1 Tax=Gordionus sp. m RMFG-2023 TaxID=3053472 RepID=UPI0030E2DCC6
MKGVIKPVSNVKPFTKIFYNNDWHDSINGKKFSTYNPATEGKICDVEEGDEADINEAVESAKMAFNLPSSWRLLDASKRSLIMLKMADILEENTSLLASLESIDSGKPFKDSVNDVVLAIGVLRYYAGWCDKITGQTIPVDGFYFTYTKREPIGVVGAIVTWCYPIIMFIYKMAPAVAMGCTIIIKPAEETSLTSLYLAFFAKEAGFPPGVISVVPGRGDVAGKALAHHMSVEMITFTGSCKVGKLIQQASGLSNLKRVKLELGGKSPTIVFGDVDVDFAVQKAQEACFFNMGQCCSAGSRTFVHESIYAEFISKSRERATKLTELLGDPFDNTKQYGPQISEKQLDSVLDFIEIGMQDAAILEAGGHRVDCKGFFLQPTVFSGVTDTMKIASQEIMGPIQQILKFKTVEEVIDRANSNECGMAVGIMTNDINRILYLSSALRSGSIWINCYQAIKQQTPFGGYKQSGLGREFGEESVYSYTELKTITIATQEKLP